MAFSRRDFLRVGAVAALAPLTRLTTHAQSDVDIDLELVAKPGRVRLLPGAMTDVWQFTGRVISGPASSLTAIPGSYLGPTLRLPRGARVRITFRNQLPDPSIVHWHGLDVPEAADGHPRFAVPGGGTYRYEFTVTNRAGTYWYHPHPHMQTGPQVYSGLAGMLIVTDEVERALSLPSGPQELVAVLQDRRFDASNQLVYSTSMMDLETGMLGDRMLVNGALTPTWDVTTRAYRLRVLNGSNARIYKLAWHDGTPLTVLGCDGGLMETPRTRTHLTLAPGQRADLWVNLTERAVGSTLRLVT
ncbi:MAG: multicopper oxidase domain-containing protein, partial [Acidobacteria bacterium]|nr:multicopper oxidase domain-containing protein [Acidobacteriota bacterium]